MNERAGEEGGSASQVIWAVASSSRVTIGLALAISAWIFLGTQVPQGAVGSDLVARYPYGLATAIQSLGLHQALSAWVFALLVLLLALNVVAYLLSRGENLPGGKGLGWTRSMAFDVPGLKDSEVGAFLKKELGIRKWGADGQVLRGVRGAVLEGSVLVLSSLIMLVVGSSLGWNNVQGRLVMEADAERGGEAQVVEALVPGAQTWVPGELPVSLTCEGMAQHNPQLQRTCRVRTPGGDYEGVLGLGGPLVADGYVLRYRSRQWMSEKMGRFYAAEANGVGETSHFGKVGTSYRVSAGQGDKAIPVRLAPHLRSGGLFLSLTGDGKGDMWVAADFPLSDVRASMPVQLRLLGAERFTVEVLLNRWHWWFLVAGALLLLGVALLTLIPHAAVELTPRPAGGYRLELGSLNRPFFGAELQKSERVGGSR